METTGSFGSPYLTIWTQPRRTIRQIVDQDPRYRVLFLVILGAELAAVSGLLLKPDTLTQTTPQVSPQMLQHTLRMVSIGALVVSPLFAIISLYAAGVLFRWAGGLLGGIATPVEVRAAVAWSSVPTVVSTAVALLGLITEATTAPVSQNPVGLRPLLHQVNAFEVIYLLLAIWGVVIWLKCLGEVHRFSAWRALGASAIAVITGVVAIFVLVVALTVAAMLLMHHL